MEEVIVVNSDSDSDVLRVEYRVKQEEDGEGDQLSDDDTEAYWSNTIKGCGPHQVSAHQLAEGEVFASAKEFEALVRSFGESRGTRYHRKARNNKAGMFFCLEMKCSMSKRDYSRENDVRRAKNKDKYKTEQRRVSTQVKGACPHKVVAKRDFSVEEGEPGLS